MEDEKKKNLLEKMSLTQVFAMGIGIVLVLAILFSAIFGVVLVKRGSQSAFALKSAQVLGLDVAKINGIGVSYVDYVGDLNTVKTFYKSQEGSTTVPSDQEMSDQVLSRLMANALIKNIAEEYDIEVTDEDVEKMQQNLLAQFASEEEANQELEKRYGWDLDTYTTKVIIPLIREQKLQENFDETTANGDDKFAVEKVRASHILFPFGEDGDDGTIKAEAERVLQEIKDGADFAEKAKEYGSDSTAQNGGDLGWFSKGDMVPEFEEAVFALEPGQLSDDLVETMYGYHIIKLTDQKVSKDFFAFMDDMIKNADIKILSNVHNPFESINADTTANTDEGDDSVDESDTVVDDTEAVDTTNTDVEVE